MQLSFRLDKRPGESHLAQPDANDINAINSLLPGLPAQFRTATPQEVAQLPRIVDPQLLEGTTVNFSRSLICLALDVTTC